MLQCLLRLLPLPVAVGGNRSKAKQSKAKACVVHRAWWHVVCQTGKVVCGMVPHEPRRSRAVQCSTRSGPTARHVRGVACIHRICTAAGAPPPPLLERRGEERRFARTLRRYRSASSTAASCSVQVQASLRRTLHTWDSGSLCRRAVVWILFLVPTSSSTAARRQ